MTLNGYVTYVGKASVSDYIQSAHVAVSVLELDGPNELAPKLAEVNDHLAAENSERRASVYAYRINLTWVMNEITAINKIVREQSEVSTKSKKPSGLQ